ncbi:MULTISPECIES: putative colanic acid biosynthesis acetyltransferase [unclassified Dysgonomonas]|uniref:putative colanic acid biosynthesis acetyltransferase n=1 Tax=unclassified Dysgonomonas TaxID=2630389 RepID=UPI002473DA16|nr:MULTISPECIES: putative colanic acid biosynthesis acetyltransferase [unclassified Dysgonomonas]
MGANVSYTSMAFGSTDISRPWDLTIGRYVALGPRVRIYNLNKIKIGDNTVISQDVYLCGGTHDYTDGTLPLLRKDITIEKNVWICAGAFISPGVTIGEGAIVGARAAVFKDVEPWTIVGGNPAKFIKKRVIVNH